MPLYIHIIGLEDTVHNVLSFIYPSWFQDFGSIALIQISRIRICL